MPIRASSCGGKATPSRAQTDLVDNIGCSAAELEKKAGKPGFIKVFAPMLTLTNRRPLSDS
jgi:hypothetical protein